MAGNVRRVNKGLVRGWQTVEVCTNDPLEVGVYLRGHDPYARVWISATGTIWMCTDGTVGPNCRDGHAMHGQTITIIANTQYKLLGTSWAQQQMADRTETFRNPNTGDLDVDSFCVRTKDPL